MREPTNEIWWNTIGRANGNWIVHMLHSLQPTPDALSASGQEPNNIFSSYEPCVCALLLAGAAPEHARARISSMPPDVDADLLLGNLPGLLRDSPYPLCFQPHLLTSPHLTSPHSGRLYTRPEAPVVSLVHDGRADTSS